jgi:hypothetical protein
MAAEEATRSRWGAYAPLARFHLQHVIKINPWMLYRSVKKSPRGIRAPRTDSAIFIPGHRQLQKIGTRHSSPTNGMRVSKNQYKVSGKELP